MHTYPYDKFKKDPRPIVDMLGKSTFQALLKKTQLIQTADTLLQNMLPEELVGHCRLINLFYDTAVIECGHAGVATRLRYLTRELCSNLRYHDFMRTINKIKVKVRSATPKKKIVKRPPNPISNGSCDIIRESAAGIRNETLKAALLKLSRR